MIRKHIWVSGVVQGVGYRFGARHEAERLGVTGWVRNLPDGRVEAICEGDAGDVEAFVRWCRAGPPGAVVREAVAKDETPAGDLGTFDIAR